MAWYCYLSLCITSYRQIYLTIDKARLANYHTSVLQNKIAKLQQEKLELIKKLAEPEESDENKINEFLTNKATRLEKELEKVKKTSPTLMLDRLRSLHSILHHYKSWILQETEELRLITQFSLWSFYHTKGLSFW